MRGAFVFIQPTYKATLGAGVLIRICQPCIVMSQFKQNFAAFHIVIVVFDYWDALLEHLYALLVVFPWYFGRSLAQN